METLKKLWEKVKETLKKLWEKVKAWTIKTAIPWLKKSWMQIVNIIVVFIGYNSLDEKPGIQDILGIWLFLLLAYYIFWKLLGAEKMFPKKQPAKVVSTTKTKKK